MLRDEAAAGSELGRRVDAIMKTGKLVDDATMAEVVRERLARGDAAGGYILDGYPRTLPQAEALDRLLVAHGETLDAVISLLVPEAALYERARGRGRADDAVLDERLRVYRENYPALAAYYAPAGLLREVDGDRPIEAVTEALLAAIGAGVAGAG
jgi:adenylate kinase